MPTYRTVVVGVHDSPTGRRAVELAAPLSSESGARLVLVAAYGSSNRPHESEAYLEPGTESARLALERAEEICEQLGVVDFESHAVAGEPAAALTQAVRTHHADLLLVGSHGLATLGGRLLGSVPGEVAREADCDVLVVHTTTDRWRGWRQRLRTSPPNYRRTVLVGVHDSPRSMRALNRAAGIAADFDTSLLVVGAYEEPYHDEFKRASDALGRESYLAKGSYAMERVLRDAEARARVKGARDVTGIAVRGDAMKALLAVADEHRVDILVMGNHQLTGPVSQVVGSISAQVSRKVATHVLLVH